MRRDLPDFFLVDDCHLAIHARLENWSRWVEYRLRLGGKAHPMWAKTISNARQWHEPELKQACNPLEGQAMEKAVAMLPDKHRDAIRWQYVWRSGPLHMARRLGVTKDGLCLLVKQGRQMLVNRGA